MLFKLLIVPILLLGAGIGLVVALQFMAGDKGEALKTAEGGILLLAKTFFAIAVTIFVVGIVGILFFAHFLSRVFPS